MTIGIIGAYGVIGKVVAEGLIKSLDCNLIIGGRDGQKLEKLCNQLGTKAKATPVDIDDRDSLIRFCRACKLVINCAGPSWIIKDRVIQVASECGCDYIDPGIWVDKDDTYTHVFQNKGLTGMLYAGWIPGISGLLPRHLFQKAMKRMDSIQSLTVYLGDRSVWSHNAMLDALYHFVREVNPGYFQNGHWISRSGTYAMLGSKIYKHPGDIGRYLVTPVDAFELQNLAKETRLPRIGCYAGIAGLSTILKVMYIRYLRISDDQAVKILTNAFVQESRKHGTGGAVSCIACGKTNGKKAILSMYVCEKDTVWLTSIATVVAAGLLVQRKMKTKGLGLFCDMVAPDDFFKALEAYGVVCNWMDGVKASPAS